MSMRKLLLMSGLALLLAAPSARADWFVTPFVGGNWGGDTNTNSRKAPFGVSFGYMGGGIIGYEAQLNYTPSFFGDKNLIGTNNVFSLMGNVIVGVPIGGERQIRPYVSGGVGWMRSRIGGATDLFDITQNDFGLDIGAGAMGFFSPHVGLRGDVRYFRSINGTTNVFTGGLPSGVDLGSLSFWQATGGVSFRF